MANTIENLETKVSVLNLLQTNLLDAVENVKEEGDKLNEVVKPLLLQLEKQAEDVITTGFNILLGNHPSDDTKTDINILDKIKNFTDASIPSDFEDTLNGLLQSSYDFKKALKKEQSTNDPSNDEVPEETKDANDLVLKFENFKDSFKGEKCGLDIGGSLTKIVYSVELSETKILVLSCLLKKVYSNFFRSIRNLKKKLRIELIRDKEEFKKFHSVLEELNLIALSIKADGSRLIMFKDFEAADLDPVIKFIKDHGLLASTTLKVTGGGAYKYNEELMKEFALEKIDVVDEMKSVCEGIKFIHQFPNSVITYDYNTGRFFTTSLGELDYPFLVVNIGSGVSIISVEGPDDYSRVSGTCVGGGTMYGLVKCFVRPEHYSEISELYGGQGALDCHEDTNMEMINGYASVPIYSSLANLSDPIATSREELTTSLVDMISYNIGALSHMLARVNNSKRIFFTGLYPQLYRITMNATVRSLKYIATVQETDTFDVFIPKHCGFLGAIGSLVATP